MEIILFTVLLVVFQVKHLIADYYLQFPYMYENKGKPTGWINPLLDHTIVHAGFTWVIALIFIGAVIDCQLTALTVSFAIALFDLATHFVTDRWKATRKTDPSQAFFWTSLGIDQMIHHLVGIAIAYFLVAYYV